MNSKKKQTNQMLHFSIRLVCSFRQFIQFFDQVTQISSQSVQHMLQRQRGAVCLPLYMAQLLTNTFNF